MNEPPCPASRPCVSCPYRQDVPAGLWDESEYAKLPGYDLPIHEQAMAGVMGAFYCHQQDGRLCAGWVGVHGTETLAIRLMLSRLSAKQQRVIVDYETGVPLFDSGTSAAEHGMSGVENPGPEAREMIDRLTRKLGTT